MLFGAWSRKVRNKLKLVAAKLGDDAASLESGEQQQHPFYFRLETMNRPK